MLKRIPGQNPKNDFLFFFSYFINFSSYTFLWLKGWSTKSSYTCEHLHYLLLLLFSLWKPLDIGLGNGAFRDLLGTEGKEQRMFKSGETLQKADQQGGPVGSWNSSDQQQGPADPKCFPLHIWIGLARYFLEYLYIWLRGAISNSSFIVQDNMGQLLRDELYQRHRHLGKTRVGNFRVYNRLSCAAAIMGRVPLSLG